VILAFDGAATDLSVALAARDGSLVDEIAWTTAQRQSAEMLPRAEALLRANGVAWQELAAVAVGTGPGSFTGLRVAMALAKGLALGLGRPIVGVPSLAAWLVAEPDAVAAVARAGAREAYVAAPDGSVRIVDRDDLAGGADRRRGPIVAAAELASAFGLADARSPRGARAIARGAARRLDDEPAGDDLRRLEPIYLRAPRGVTVDTEATVRWL
jgi:tRNA threonylcarbamoyl adenosine modification protein YeaZ